MKKFRFLLVYILIIFNISGCTTAKNFYIGEDNLDSGEEFSTLNTILLPVGIVALTFLAIGAAGASGSGTSKNYTSSCNGTYCFYNAAWDYLPGSGQYRCRDTRNGQFVEDFHCSSQAMVDNWY